MEDAQDKSPDFTGSGPVEYIPAEANDFGAVRGPIAQAEAQMLAMPGVVSVGLGQGSDGREVLVVGVIDGGVSADLPAQIDGVPVTAVVTGEVDALPTR
jgi:hypothetical protein